MVTTNFATLVYFPPDEGSEDERYMRGGVKTAAGKNRIIPIAEKIYPFIAELYNVNNEFLLLSP